MSVSKVPPPYVLAHAAFKSHVSEFLKEENNSRHCDQINFLGFCLFLFSVVSSNSPFFQGHDQDSDPLVV